MSQNLSVIGQRAKRIDRSEIVTGSAEYSIDSSRPGMLYARMLTSPYPHAKITAIDTSKAEVLSGVKAVLTYKDSTSTPYPPDTYILDSEVRFVGDEVAAVAATDPLIAEAALDLISVTYQQLPAVFTTTDALKTGAPLVHADVPGNVVKSQSYNYQRGNPSSALSTSDYTFTLDFSTPSQPIVGINPYVALAEWSDDGHLTVWDSNQGGYSRQTDLSLVLGLPLNKITVIQEYCGCGFGEDNVFRYLPIAALLSKKAGLPVKFEPGKAYQFEACMKKRHPTSGTGTIGINKDGTITALVENIIWDKGAYAAGGRFVTGAKKSTFGTYSRIPNMGYVATAVYTNNPPSGAFRGYGDPQGHFGTERLINKAAEELGLDPVDIRSKVIGQPGDMNYAYWPAVGPYASAGYADCMAKGAQMIGWQSRWQPFKAKTSTALVRTGVGMGLYSHGTGETGSDTSLVVVMNRDGTAFVMGSISEIGTGIPTVVAQSVAEELGLPLTSVNVVWGSTDLPETRNESSSSAAHTTCYAAKRAADQVKAQLFSVAALILNCNPSDLSSQNGVIYLTANPSTSVTIAKVMADSRIPKSLTGYGTNRAPEGTARSVGQGANFVEVQVDTETGEVNVAQMVAVADAGKALNPLIVEQQILGGAIQGIGLGTEEVVIDQNNGTPLTSRYLDYGLNTMDTVPEIDPIIVESNDTAGPWGAKGVGEPADILPIATVSSAIYNAIGQWIDPPFTPAKVLHALGKV